MALEAEVARLGAELADARKHAQHAESENEELRERLYAIKQANRLREAA